MDKDDLIKYCKQHLALLTSEQLEAIKEQIDKKIKQYEDDY